MKLLSSNYLFFSQKTHPVQVLADLLPFLRAAKVYCPHLLLLASSLSDHRNMAMERATQITVNCHVSTTVNTRTLAWHVAPADQDVWDSYKDLQQAPGKYYTLLEKHHD